MMARRGQQSTEEDTNGEAQSKPVGGPVQTSKAYQQAKIAGRPRPAHDSIARGAGPERHMIPTKLSLGLLGGGGGGSTTPFWPHARHAASQATTWRSASSKFYGPPIARSSCCRESKVTLRYAPALGDLGGAVFSPSCSCWPPSQAELRYERRAGVRITCVVRTRTAPPRPCSRRRRPGCHWHACHEVRRRGPATFSLQAPGLRSLPSSGRGKSQGGHAHGNRRRDRVPYLLPADLGSAELGRSARERLSDHHLVRTRFCVECLRAATRHSSKCSLCRGPVHYCEEKTDDSCAMCRAGIVSIKEAAAIEVARQRGTPNSGHRGGLRFERPVHASSGALRRRRPSMTRTLLGDRAFGLSLVAMAAFAFGVVVRACWFFDRVPIWHLHGGAARTSAWPLLHP